ncbi:UNVERIFIED_CONTAM: response regulator receiver and ANTAR domain protein [Acetivibrio alkalicellulosi]
MDCEKFVLAGEDKNTLISVKNALSSSGYIYTGYTKEHANTLRLIRRYTPELTVIDVGNNFKDLREQLIIIDEEILCACILILDYKNDAIIDFIKNSRILTYIRKPIFDENIIQIAEMSTINYKRVLEYEQKLKKLNETLESRKVVEKAKWILVEEKGLSESEAYDLLRKKSRDSRVPMKNIAEAIILTKGIVN